MKTHNIHFLDKNLWHGTRARRSTELTPLYIERYLGPRQSTRTSSHAFWELTCVPAGCGRLIGSAPVDLTPGTLCLVPPGLDHAERGDEKLDTLWIGLKGKYLSNEPVAQTRWVHNQTLVNRVEQLWLFVVRQSGRIGPELDAMTAGIVATFFRLLSEGAKEPLAADALERAMLLFHQQFFTQISIAETARRFGYSTGHFCRTFKQRTGQAPIHYLTDVRLRHAKRLLEYTSLPILQVANQAGYEDQFYFSRVFRKVTDLTPTKYRHTAQAHH
ncbi:MAG: AraC family transcriptional regulator [Kiritimatiellaeota bacterium]|nr:AraC family transcriptional regulator [Kiritimatiellota bacterium]